MTAQNNGNLAVEACDWIRSRGLGQAARNVGESRLRGIHGILIGALCVCALNARMIWAKRGSFRFITLENKNFYRIEARLKMNKK